MSKDVPVPFTADLSPDEFVQAAMEWHFSPDTGSPFWVKRAAELPFDPLRDIRTWADLDLFPDVSEEWRDVPVDTLVPVGIDKNDWDFRVFDSGGTTGRPKRIVESRSRREGVQWVSTVLDEHKVPGVGDGHWLHIGPTGPHIVGRSIGLLAQLRQTFCHYIDFDPRWVKQRAKQQQTNDVAQYVQHVLDQALDVLRTQPVSVLFATPPILEAISDRDDILDLVQNRVRGIIWAGTSISPETLHVLETELFPNAAVVGLYGNTMMGIAPQRPGAVGPDGQPCVFIPHYPYSRVRLVDPEETTRDVAYGERGQARISLISRDLLLPWTLERDSALCIEPTSAYPQDGVADVRPLTSGNAPSVVEGVY
ncbi:phenazine biosynthesis protein [Streptomyces roseifaciens]|uniref:phenazine biosynthesis protein n=1 Tax=Streptomyces roseifaciens TaxID=1488406 RepID=UPI000717F9F4|nr:phenazine biosynthesis protein [Streptomyces roseifaciens]